MQFKRCLAWLLAVLMALACMPVLAEEINAEQVYDAEIKYSIDVDIINQIVSVYPVDMPQTGENIVRQMICSTGYGDTTPLGTFEMCPPRYETERQEWYYFYEYEVWAKYASRIQGNYLFHSILYAKQNSNPTWESSNALGSKASHGCVRLRPDDAKWIAENCPPGTMVYIHEDNERTSEFEDLREILLTASFISEDVSYKEFCKGYIPLSKGSTYSKVVDLQEMLNALGYDCGDADGIFGSATERGVKAWQEAMGYEADGIVTPAQLEAILTSEIPEPVVEMNVEPTPEPTAEPTAEPTPEPTAEPTAEPTPEPTAEPTAEPTPEPTAEPTAEPTPEPTAEPTAEPTPEPTAEPTAEPTPEPTAEPTAEPTPEPTAEPTAEPTPEPSPVPKGTIARVQVQEGSHLLLRINPSRQAAVISTLPGGTELTVLKQIEGWMRVRCSEGTGWVSSDYIVVEVPQNMEPTPEPSHKPRTYAEIIKALNLQDMSE